MESVHGQNQEQRQGQRILMNTILSTKDGNVSLNAPVFMAYTKAKGGFLCDNECCHALMYYAILARNAYEENVKGDGFQYESTKDNVTDFRQLIVSISELYDVTPEAMICHWKEVDAQFIFLELPKLPAEERYRFNNRIEIITRH